MAWLPLSSVPPFLLFDNWNCCCQLTLVCIVTFKSSYCRLANSCTWIWIGVFKNKEAWLLSENETNKVV